MHLRQGAAKLLRTIHASHHLASARAITANAVPNALSSNSKCLQESESAGFRWRKNHTNSHLWIVMAGQAGVGHDSGMLAAIFFGMNANPVLADPKVESSSENNLEEGSGIVGLRKVEDGSITSNEHTSKWRIFTDNGRDFFLQGKLEQAEQFFLSALEEAKVGFGETDPHVASACNNLAELYRVKKEFDKAEPLYLEAIKILEKSLGPEDIRVGAALHNLGQFYLMRRKLEEAHKSYEHALKIKGSELGLNHVDYADTMYHLGTVLHLLGKEKDAESFVLGSIRILEGNGQGESLTCMRRLRYLAQMYIKSNRLSEAENIQRKILHIMELSKGWNSMETVFAAEALALTLQPVGNLKEAEELLERCLEVRKVMLPENHIQIAANLLRIAGVKLLKSNQLKNRSISEAVAELDKAEDLLNNSTRIARQFLNKMRLQNNKIQKSGESYRVGREGDTALAILLQSLDTLALSEAAKQEMGVSVEDNLLNGKAKNALRQCISAYKEFEAERLTSGPPKAKSLYVSCLNHFSSLISDSTAGGRSILQEASNEIRRVQTEISHRAKPKV